jgi:hypothetical protein
MSEPRGTTFWDFLLISIDWIGDRSTRALGVVQGLVGLALLQCIDTDGHIVAHPLVPVKWIPWMVFSAAAATYLRGQFTSNTVTAAKAVLAQPKEPAPVTIVNPVEITSGAPKS